MNKRAYPGDISCRQISPLLPLLESARKRIAPRKMDLHDVFCAIPYLLRNGCTWCTVPGGSPNGAPFIPVSRIESQVSPLNKQDKEADRLPSKPRIVIGHINSKQKIFKILSLPYRNRRKRFGLRANLIAGWFMRWVNIFARGLIMAYSISGSLLIPAKTLAKRPALRQRQ